jgi:tRNA modification GTPase
MNFAYNAEDTIVALSTPLGNGAIAVIRISGKNSFSITNKLTSKKITKKFARRAIYCSVYGIDRLASIDNIVLTVFVSPYSYTGEDLIEISCHCNPLIIDAIIERITSLGARVANPGEFTLRAFLNNKIDLSQAEAVTDVINAKTKQSLYQSQRHLDGKYSTVIHNIKNEVLKYLSLIEISLDFSDEEIEPISREKFESNLNLVINQLKHLLETYDYGRLLQEGIKVLILGKPNTGKSSLLNYFVGKERAIVSSIPGTTRDYIEESFVLNGINLKLVDSAGIRNAQNEIERLGIIRAKDQLGSSDIIVCMFEAHRELDDDDKKLIELMQERRQSQFKIYVANKIDLGEYAKTIDYLSGLNDSLVKISIRCTIGIDHLENMIKNKIIKDSSLETEEIVVTNSRHKKLIQEALEALNVANESLKSFSTEEIIAVDLRIALDRLGEITGEITTEDVLDHIFSNFCIGK